jgi:hypothetical protein
MEIFLIGVEFRTDGFEGKIFCVNSARANLRLGSISYFGG